MPKQTARVFDVDTASMALGRAWGLAQMCKGQMERIDDGRPCAFVDVRSTLQFISLLAMEAAAACATAPDDVCDTVERARGVSEVVAADATVEYLGRVGQHWNDEVTEWALSAMCEALDLAKKAVDDAALASCSESESRS